jgi:hypothetical protein
MRKMCLGLVVSVGAALFLGSGIAAAGTADQKAPTVAPKAVNETPQCVASDTQASETQVAWLLSSSDEKTCSDFGMYEHNQLKKCEKECQGNRKQCEKRQRCGGGKCPDPGYCWKCVEH